MSTPPMPGGPQGPQAPQGQPYPAAPQGQPYPAGPQGQQFPGAQQPYPGGAPGQQQQPYPGAGPVPGGGPVPGTGPMPQGANPGGFPPAPGQPQPFPQAPLTTPVKKKRGRLAAILSGVGVLLIALIVKVAISFGIGSAVTSADDAHNTAVGECASVTGTTTKPNYEKVDCASGKQNYVVGVVMKPSDKCADGYDEYYEEGTLNNVKLCLAPVFEDGKCYNLLSPSMTDMGRPAITCTDPNAIQVKVVKDKADVSACKDPDPTHAMIYQPLKLTYCLSQPSGS